jgi:hypothetical protein
MTLKIIQIILEQQLLKSNSFDINQAGGVFVFKIKIQAAIGESSLYEL